MKKFFVICVAMLNLVACGKDEKTDVAQATDVTTQDGVVDVAADATAVATDVTVAVDAAESVSPTTEVTPSK
jgi:hypothetical protein